MCHLMESLPLRSSERHGGGKWFLLLHSGQEATKFLLFMSS